MIHRFLWPFAFYLFLFLTASSPALRTAAAFVAGIYMCNSLYVFILSRSIQIRRRDPVLRAYKNSRQTVELILENHSLLPLFSSILQDGGEHRILVHLRPRERKLVRYQLRPTERGEFKQGPASLLIGDLFGNFRKRIVVTEEAILIVYPSLQKLSYQPGRGYPLGSLPSVSPMDEDPTRFRSVREYVQGDELRRINWKVSAKAGSLYCNEYEIAMDSPLMLFLNLHPESYPLTYRYLIMEQAISYGASLISAAAGRGQAVGLVSSASMRGSEEEFRIEPECGAATALLDILARLRPGTRPPWDCFLRATATLPYRAQAWYVGPDPGSRSFEFSRAAEKRGAEFRLYLTQLPKEAAERLKEEGIRVSALELQDGA